MPSLRQLSDSLGVNHITISRAVGELETEGVLRIVPGKGTFVAQAETGDQVIQVPTLFSERQYLLNTSHHTLKLDCIFCDPAPQMQTLLGEYYHQVRVALRTWVWTIISLTFLMMHSM